MLLILDVQRDITILESFMAEVCVCVCACVCVCVCVCVCTVWVPAVHGVNG